MYTFRQFAFVFFSISATSCTEVKSTLDAADYLKQYGYIPDMTRFRYPTGDSFKSKKMFTEGISMFQMYAGIKQSGRFDNDTMTMMNMPRCGMSESMEIFENKHINSSTVRHMIPRRGWRVSTIYYRIANFPTSFELKPVVARSEIRRAFRLWENVANIRCIEVPPRDTKHAEIDVLFASSEHGDGNAFGQLSFGNVVAHAFFPNHRHFEGDIHFDNERLWTAFNFTGINLFQVAAHEIGHALGLDHSRFPDSVMHMIVKSELKNDFQLHDDDIKGIQKLYGPRGGKQMSYRERGHYQRKLPKFGTEGTGVLRPQMGLNQRMTPQDVTTNVLEFPDSPSQAKSVNVNAVITVPMVQGSDMASELEPVLGNFWKCLSLMNRDENETENSSQSAASECYKENVLRLLYSLKII